MSHNLAKLRKDRDKEIPHYKREVVKLYKDGYALGEICRKVKLDISTILLLLKLQRFKKRRLYDVYENQADKSRENYGKLLLKRDEYYLEKFFPNSNSIFSTNYYWFWREKQKKREDIQSKCKHKVRHIRCSLCEKILGDATNIPLNANPIISEADYTTEEETAI